jgi:hypothetical protein
MLLDRNNLISLGLPCEESLVSKECPNSTLYTNEDKSLFLFIGGFGSRMLLVRFPQGDRGHDPEKYYPLQMSGFGGNDLSFTGTIRNPWTDTFGLSNPMLKNKENLSLELEGKVFFLKESLDQCELDKERSRNVISFPTQVCGLPHMLKLQDTLDYLVILRPAFGYGTPRIFLYNLNLGVFTLEYDVSDYAVYRDGGTVRAMLKSENIELPLYIPTHLKKDGISTLGDVTLQEVEVSKELLEMVVKTKVFLEPHVFNTLRSKAGAL